MDETPTEDHTNPDHVDTPDNVAETLHDLVERVDGLSARVDELETASQGDPSAGFLEWLHRTLARYYLADQEEAILINAALLAEWQGLYKAHKGAYRAKAGDFEQVFWHDALARVLGRTPLHKSHQESAIYAALQPDSAT